MIAAAESAISVTVNPGYWTVGARHALPANPAASPAQNHATIPVYDQTDVPAAGSSDRVHSTAAAAMENPASAASARIARFICSSLGSGLTSGPSCGREKTGTDFVAMKP